MLIEFHDDPQIWIQAQAQAEKEGRVCVVGGLIRDPLGRVFVMRRAAGRKLFPGCWDIAGGHVEPGETLFDALQREIREETGWKLRRVLGAMEPFDWKDDWGESRVREFDFVVEVDGDLTRAEIEKERFSEYRWVGPQDLESLRENRDPEDQVIYELVRQALEFNRLTLL